MQIKRSMDFAPTKESDFLIDTIVATIEIVRAYVSHNTIPVDGMHGLITSVHDAITGLGNTAPDPTPKLPDPAVSVRASVKPDVVTCIECGFSGKMLKRHLLNTHGMTPAEYRKRWKLSADHPLVAPSYTEKRKEIAINLGLGRKPGTKTKKR